MKKQQFRIPAMAKPKDYYKVRWYIAHFCIEHGYSYEFLNHGMPVRFLMEDVPYEAEVISRHAPRSPLSWYISCRKSEDYELPFPVVL